MKNTEEQIKMLQKLNENLTHESQKRLITTLFFLIFIVYSSKAMSADRLDYNLEKQVGYAMNACAYSIRNVDKGKSPAESVSMSDYLKFTSNYESAKAQKADIESNRH